MVGTFEPCASFFGSFSHKQPKILASTAPISSESYTESLNLLLSVKRFRALLLWYSAELVSSPRTVDTSDNTDPTPVILPNPIVLLKRGGGEEVVGYGLGRAPHRFPHVD